MSIRYLLFICFVTLVCSCKTNNSQDTPNTPSEKKDVIVVSEKAIANFKFDDYRLSKDAQNVVATWDKYQELSTQISYLKQADITFFASEKDTLKVFLKTMRQALPNTINTKPVASRLTVLENTLLKLNNDLNLQNYPDKRKLESIKALLIAHSDFIFLINKKLEFDSNEVDRPNLLER